MSRKRQKLQLMENSANRLEVIPSSTGCPSLAAIPQLQRIMESPHAQRLCAIFRREDLVALLRAKLAQVRACMVAGEHIQPDFFSDHFFETLRVELALRQQHSLVRVINATGVVLHTNLGRAPLAAEALAEVHKVSTGYCNLEFDLASGERGTRYAHVEALLCRLTGAEAALVVNNCAAAVLLGLSALATDAEVLVSRGELIEIGGSFRMPDVIAQSGARMVEVGTTNKTRLADYERAITERTRVILKSHPSNYRIVGFCEETGRDELAGLAQRHNIVLMEDLGSGSLVDLQRYGLPYEPTVQECVQGGAHVVMFSGDKLLGGPQAGIIVGRKNEITALKSHPLLRAVRIDKLALGALEATLRLYELPEPVERHIPVLRMLAEDVASVRRRARTLRRALGKLPGAECWLEEGRALPGGGSLPQAELSTTLIKLRIKGRSARVLAHQLRGHRPALVGRIIDDCFVMDLRTVTQPEVIEIARIVAEVIR